MHTFLAILVGVWKTIEVVAALNLVLIALLGLDWVVDSVKRHYSAKKIKREQEKLRRQKEEEAHEGFFTTTFTKGFDSNGVLIARGHRVLTPAAHEYYRIMDELADDKIFRNTEEL